MANTFWPEGKTAALSLSFDDARLSQVDYGLPLLDAYGVKSTFYVSLEPMRQRLDQWRQALENGHEIGNHTVNHPCSGNFAFSRHCALEDYSLERMEKEITEANAAIEQDLGITPKTFAYPCGQKFVGRGQGVKSYVPLVAAHFMVGRDAFNEVPNDPTFTDLAQATALDLDGASFEALEPRLEQARQQKAWLIFLGHEVDHQGGQTVRVDVLEKFYQALEGSDIWVDTVERIGTYIKQKRGD